MKRYKQLFLSFLLCVCLFGVCSLDAKAYEPTDYMYKVSYTLYSNATNSWEGSWTNTGLGYNIPMGGTMNFPTDTQLEYSISFKTADSKPLAKKGETLDAFIDGVIPYLEFGSTYYLASVSPVHYSLYAHTQSGTKYFDFEYIDIGFGSQHEINFEISDILADEDIYSIELFFKWELSQFFDYDLGNRDYQTGLNCPQDLFRVEFETEEVGMLKGILAFLKQGFQNIGDWFQELPQNIMNGIKNLFIPSQSTIVEYKSKWDELLSDRFGAIYECGTLIFDMWEDVSYHETQGTIYFPQVDINVGEGESFFFGGWDVKIVPDGFEGLADAVKMITSVGCTLLFINGLRKRYDEVMTGGNVS